jgi:tRNA(Ile)-lysidine synthase
MDLFQKFITHWQKEFNHLSSNTCQLLLAVSGGVDSVVLVDIISKAGFDFCIAHCNFQLRGEESTRDEMFVTALGKKYGKKVLVKHFDTQQYATDKKISIQEAARDLRYGWFAELVQNSPEKSSTEQQYPGNYIVTAHHADDNIETMLMHFFRGTGIQGLTGIQPISKQRKLIRPILPFRKKELLAYASENGLDFVEDSSNASDKYTRNFFRNQLLPQIKEVFPQVEENLLNNIDRFQDVAEIYRQSVAQHIDKLLEQKDTEWHVPVLKWKKLKPLHTITWELIKTFGFHAAQTEEVIKLLDGENGAYQSSATHRIIRNRNWMIISPNSTETAQHVLIEAGEKNIIFEKGSLVLTTAANPKSEIRNDSAEASLNTENITFPLLLRKWKAGDYFYPLGMQKKKKISRFLIDLKLSKTEKEAVWVIESNKKILWVIGYRIDNRFRITEQTDQILHITYRK